MGKTRIIHSFGPSIPGSVLSGQSPTQRASLLATRLVPGATIYTHDELHNLVAFTSGKPIYVTLKKPGQLHMAKRERELFEAAPAETQLKLVREEAMAIAAERLVLPALINGMGRCDERIAPFRPGDQQRMYEKGT